MTASTMKWAILLCSVLGIADSWYLAQSALTDTPLVCGIENLDGCNVVAQSVYSHLFGIPLGVYGVVFYALLIVVSAIAIAKPRAWVPAALVALGAIGLVASIIFEAIQIFLIKAICIYCLGSAILSALVFVFALLLWKRLRTPTPLSVPAAVVS